MKHIGHPATPGHGRAVPQMVPRLEQTILVTEASRGIGAASARALASHGARVIVHYGHERAAAEAVLAEIGGCGFVIQADLAHPDGAITLWKAAEAAAGRIDALVNNAGIMHPVCVEGDLCAWQVVWRDIFQVNLFSPAVLCKMAIQHFRLFGGGKIVNIASRAGHRGGFLLDAMAYGAAKAGLINLTKTIAQGCAREGIYAIAFDPGFTNTEMAQGEIDAYGREAAVGDIPLGGMLEPEELAELIAFVLQPGQRFLTGATIDVNGASYVR